MHMADQMILTERAVLKHYITKILKSIKNRNNLAGARIGSD